jgi:L-seryl-tRNA(Ser) seleniumtransferase
MARALRVDKLTLAALEATLALYRDPARAVREVPALAMLTAPPESVRRRAEALAVSLTAALTAALGTGSTDGVEVTVEACESTVGGGAFPTARIPSFAVTLGVRPGAVDASASRLEARLRAGTIPVITRVEGGHVRLDLRSVPPPDDETLRALLLAAISPAEGRA